MSKFNRLDKGSSEYYMLLNESETIEGYDVENYNNKRYSFPNHLYRRLNFIPEYFADEDHESPLEYNHFSFEDRNFSVTSGHKHYVSKTIYLETCTVENIRKNTNETDYSENKIFVKNLVNMKAENICVAAYDKENIEEGMIDKTADDGSQSIYEINVENKNETLELAKDEEEYKEVEVKNEINIDESNLLNDAELKTKEFTKQNKVFLRDLERKILKKKIIKNKDHCGNSKKQADDFKSCQNTFYELRYSNEEESNDTRKIEDEDEKWKDKDTVDHDDKKIDEEAVETIICNKNKKTEKSDSSKESANVPNKPSTLDELYVKCHENSFKVASKPKINLDQIGPQNDELNQSLKSFMRKIISKSPSIDGVEIDSNKFNGFLDLKSCEFKPLNHGDCEFNFTASFFKYRKSDEKLENNIGLKNTAIFSNQKIPDVNFFNDNSPLKINIAKTCNDTKDKNNNCVNYSNACNSNLNFILDFGSKENRQRKIRQFEYGLTKIRTDVDFSSNLGTFKTETPLFTDFEKQDDWASKDMSNLKGHSVLSIENTKNYSNEKFASSDVFAKFDFTLFKEQLKMIKFHPSDSNEAYKSKYLKETDIEPSNPFMVDIKYAISLKNILSKEDDRTTVMIKNIPNKYSQKMLIDLLNEDHFGCFDFVYLRMDFKNKCNVGYAFVNFIDPIHIVSFYHKSNGKGWKKFSSNKIIEITYASIQGFENLRRKFSKSSVMQEKDSYRPKIFYSSGPLKGFEKPIFF